VKKVKKNSKIDGSPRKRALKKVGRGTYDTDKPSVTTFVHRESTFTIFSVEKNLSEKGISYSINEYIKDEATLCTDEYSIYQDIDDHPKIKEHHTVNHSQKNMLKVKLMLIIVKIDIHF
jgi:transposase-like protein